MKEEIHFMPIQLKLLSDFSATQRELSGFADRHYSRRESSRGNPHCAGPGRLLLLRDPMGLWALGWRKQIYRLDKQDGWECFLFRNEGGKLSSKIILQCEKELIQHEKSIKRIFTYIDPCKIKSPNPGYCFKMAGWRMVGKSKNKRLHLLEKQIGG